MRGTHLVGSLPADGPQAALRQALETVGAPLKGLRPQTGTRLVEGFAHEDQSLRDQLFVRDLIERLVGAPVAALST